MIHAAHTSSKMHSTWEETTKSLEETRMRPWICSKQGQEPSFTCWYISIKTKQVPGFASRSLWYLISPCLSSRIYIYILICALILTRNNHFRMNSTLLRLLVALVAFYLGFVSMWNSSPAILQGEYVLYEPPFIIACQLLNVALFIVEL